MPNGDKTAEILNSGVSELQELITQLKSERLPEEERRQKENEVKYKAQELQGQVDMIGEQQCIDEKLGEIRDRAKIVLASCNETLNLQSSIEGKINTRNLPDSSETVPTDSSDKETNESEETTAPKAQETGKTTDSEDNKPDKKEKGFFGKAGEWIGDKWSKIPTRGKGALGVVGTAIAGTWLYKKLWGKKEEEKKEGQGTKTNESSNNGTSRRKKGLAWAGGILGVGAIGTLAYKYWNFIKGKRNDVTGNNLTFDVALEKTKSDILNKAGESRLKQNLGLQRHEDSSELEAFGHKVKIDKNTKRIEGMEDIIFPNYEELLVAATIANYMKFTYQGLGANSKPFFVNSNIKGGDIGVNLATGKEDAVSGSGTTGKIIGGAAGGMLSLVAGIRGGGVKTGLSVAGVAIPSGVMYGDYLDGQNTLHQICPTLDTEKAKNIFASYINRQGCWEKGNQNTENLTETPITNEVREVINEIENTEIDDWENDKKGNERNLHPEQDKNNPNKYSIWSYGLETKITVDSSTKKIKIDDLDIEFELKEGIRVANFTNMMKKKYGGQCGKNDKPFSYRGSISTVGHPGLYVNTSTRSMATRTITEDTLEERYPTLYSNIENKYVPYLNSMKDSEGNLPYWVEK